MPEANALQTRARHDECIRRPHLAAIRQTLHLLLIEFANARVGRAAIVNDLNVGKQSPRIGGTAHRICADFVSLAARAFQILERHACAQHQRVARRIARQQCADHESRRLFVAGHVFHRMHRGLQLPAQHRLAYLRHERAALAAMRQQFADLILIAGGFEPDDLDFDIRDGGAKLARDLPGLGHRHRAFARPDPHQGCHHTRSVPSPQIATRDTLYQPLPAAAVPAFPMSNQEPVLISNAGPP